MATGGDLTEEGTSGERHSRHPASGKGLRGDQRNDQRNDQPQERERERERTLLGLAILSRVLTVSLMVVWDWLFRDLSRSSHLQWYACGGAGGTGGTGGDGDLGGTPRRSKIGDLAPWDSVYVIDMATTANWTTRDTVNTLTVHVRR